MSVSVRNLAEALGYSVSFDAASKAIAIQNYKMILRMAVGDARITVNTFDDGMPPREIQADRPPEIVNGRISVPVRPVAEAFGLKVKWDAETRSVYLSYLNSPLPSAR
jgi:hypothetical protein